MVFSKTISEALMSPVIDLGIGKNRKVLYFWGVGRTSGTEVELIIVLISWHIIMAKSHFYFIYLLPFILIPFYLLPFLLPSTGNHFNALSV